jgi:hypothetical protein
VTAAVRRALSIVSLIALDLCGLVLGLYAAFVLRALYYGNEVLWGALWRAESEWLPFLALVMLGLRYLVQQGIIAIPATTRVERLSIVSRTRA